MTAAWDILGLGCAAVDDLLYVLAYPSPDAKTRVLRRERKCGGLTAVALIAAARFGARCAFASVLGTDELSDFVGDALTREGIDTAHAPRLTDAWPGHSTIIVNTTNGTRSIFSESGVRVGPCLTLPPASVIQSARAILIDHHGGEGTVRAAQIARDADIPIIADFERTDVPQFARLLELADHVIVSQPFAQTVTAAATPEEAARGLLTADCQVVIVTCGSDGSWTFAQGETAPRHFPAFAVTAMDTTGCGDVFHGVYAATLVADLALPERIRYASTAAALKAAQGDIPHRPEVEAFLAGVDKASDGEP